MASPLVIIFFGIREYNQLFGNILFMGIEIWRLRTTGIPANLATEPASQLSMELWVCMTSGLVCISIRRRRINENGFAGLFKGRG
jgi:hypothetical protein